MRSLRQVDAAVHFTQEATLDALGQTVTRARIETLLRSLNCVEQRTRKLTLVLAVLLCIAMNLFTDEAIDDVLAKLLQGPRFLRPDDDLVPAGASAICQRRHQLGVAPMVALFREVCQPLATPATRDAFLCGWRLMAPPKMWPIRPPTRIILDALTADGGTAHFRRCGRSICASVEPTRSVMPVFGPSPFQNGSGVYACCARWVRGCSSLGIAAFIASICVLKHGSGGRIFWRGCPRRYT